MKPLKKNEYRRVWINWLDSVSRKRVWWSTKELLEDIELSETGDFFYSTGYLFKETKWHYYLANSIHFEDGVAVSMGHVFSIPKGCVIKIKKL